MNAFHSFGKRSSAWLNIFSVLFLLILSAILVNAQCEDVSGVWQVREQVVITLSSPGLDDEVIEMDETGSVTLVQSGCDLSYALPGLGGAFTRTGSIADDAILLSGLAAEVVAGTTCTSNEMTATGTIINAGRIEMTTSVEIQCTKGLLNITGTGTGTVTFTRSLPPVLTTQPQDLIVTELEDAVFLCEFTGDGITIYWHKKPPSGPWENISYTSLVETTATSSEITIPKTSSALSGYQYRCALVGSAVVISDVATLTVEPFPLSIPEITSNPMDITVDEKMTAYFYVVADGIPSPNYQWQVLKSSGGDWTDLTGGGRYLGIQSSGLIIANCTIAMTGDQFRCVVFNVEGSVTSGSGSLVVRKRVSSSSPLELRGIGNVVGVDVILPTGISDDGKTIPGYTKVFAGGKRNGFIWNDSAGFLWFDGDHSFMNGISGDATIACGYYRNTSESKELFFRWSDGGGKIPVALASTNISRTGSTVMGRVAGSDTHGDSGRFAAFENTGEFRVIIGDLIGGAFESIANDISDDNLTIIGTGTDAGGSVAFRWTGTSGMEALGDSSLGDYPSEGNAVSGDGNTIVGTIIVSPSYEFHAFKWTAGSGMIVLDELTDPTYSFSHRAFDVTEDGSRIVGRSTRLSGPDLISKAVFWNASGEVFDFNEVVVAEGLSLDGWELEEALAISPDGNSVVGIGSNSDPSKGKIWILSGLNGVGSGPPPGRIEITGSSLSGSDFSLDIESNSGWLYVLQKKDDLQAGDWSDVRSVSGDGGIMSLIDNYSSSDGDMFFQIFASELPDSPVPEGFVVIPSGSFIMGSPESELGRLGNETQHEVLFTQQFYMSKTEIVWEQWDEVRTWALANGYVDISVGYSGQYLGGDTENQPLSRVTWREIVLWCNAFSEYMGRTPVYHSSPDMSDGSVIRDTQFTTYLDETADGFRLPTEAEWEYACRAGSTTAFADGEITYTGSDPIDPTLDELGWYRGNAGVNHAVGLKEPNAWGLYDMHGNDSEWCGDAYVEDLGANKVINPGALYGASIYRVLRGGSWSGGSELSRSASRVAGKSNTGYSDAGFRVVAKINSE